MKYAMKNDSLTSLFLALPTRPLASIALEDADSESALAFVKSKLLLAGITEELQDEQLREIERLGGRASDLETVRHKTRLRSRLS